MRPKNDDDASLSFVAHSQVPLGKPVCCTLARVVLGLGHSKERKKERLAILIPSHHQHHHHQGSCFCRTSHITAHIIINRIFCPSRSSVDDLLFLIPSQRNNHLSLLNERTKGLCGCAPTTLYYSSLSFSHTVL